MFILSFKLLAISQSGMKYIRNNRWSCIAKEGHAGACAPPTANSALPIMTLK